MVSIKTINKVFQNEGIKIELRASFKIDPTLCAMHFTDPQILEELKKFKDSLKEAGKRISHFDEGIFQLQFNHWLGKRDYKISNVVTHLISEITMAAKNVSLAVDRTGLKDSDFKNTFNVHCLDVISVLARLQK